jgi:hypothetical protein
MLIAIALPSKVINWKTEVKEDLIIKPPYRQKQTLA